jgi:hypothetical protein
MDEKWRGEIEELMRKLMGKMKGDCGFRSCFKLMGLKKRRNKKIIQDNPRLLLEVDVVGGRRALVVVRIRGAKLRFNVL